MIDTKVCRSSLGVQSSPIPAALVMERKALRTLPAASWVCRSWCRRRGCHPRQVSPALSRLAACFLWCWRSARNKFPGDFQSPRDFLVLASPPAWYGAPDVDGELFVVEACHCDRLPPPSIFDPGHDMVPLKSTRLLCSHAGQDAEGHIRIQPGACEPGPGRRRPGRASAPCSAVPGLPFGVVASSATLRPTLSRACACRIARSEHRVDLLQAGRGQFGRQPV